MQPPTRLPSASGGGAEASESLFDRIVVGIDSTDESLVAAAQARTLCASHGRIVLLAAVERHMGAQAGFLAARAEDDLAAETSTELERARELVDAEDAVLASGDLVALLGAECVRRQATLIAVGVRPHRRLGALTFGGHEVQALHDLTCSVLIARPGWGPAHPDRLIVGVDGSDEAWAAEAVARSLASRLGVEATPVVALGEGVDPSVLRAEREDALVHPGPLLQAVAAAASPRSLVVAGRDRRGGRRTASLAERIVYAASCSVLVVDHDAQAGGAPAASRADEIG